MSAFIATPISSSLARLRTNVRQTCSTHDSHRVLFRRPPKCGIPPLATRAKSLLETRLLLGNVLTPELFAILSVYFVQGVLAFPRLALSFFLKDTLLLSPAEVASITAASMLPWVLKPLYGFLSDSVPIAQSRRRSYLILSGVLGAISWGSLAIVVNDSNTALAAMFTTSLSIAIADVVADSIVVERVRKGLGDGGELQTLCWGTSAVGGLLAAAGSGSLLAAFGARGVFGLTATLPAIVAGVAALVDEEKSNNKGNILTAARSRAVTLWGALTARHVFLPVSFVFLWQAMPTPDTALFFFQTNTLHFGPEFLGVVRLASSAAALCGLYVYNRWGRQLPIKTLMGYACAISVPLSLTQLILVTRLNVAWGISDQAFALTDSAVLTALGQVAFMPTLVLAARLCPPGIEGTLFAALMSVYNASGAVSGELGALLTQALHVTETDFDNLAWLVALCSFSNLLPLPLLNLLDNAPEESNTNDMEKSTNSKKEPALTASMDERD